MLRFGYSAIAAALFFIALLVSRSAAAEGVLRTVLVIDASSSMRATDPRGLRKVAAELYVDLARDGDQIAVTGFDGGVRESTGAFTTIRGPADRSALKQAVQAVGNDGSWTDFTAGLAEAKRLLDAAKNEAGDQEFVLFLTDGRCDPDPKGALAEAARAAGGGRRIEELCQDRVLKEILPSLGGARVYAVGLSRSAPKAFLESAGRQTGGVGLATDRAEELPRLFADVYARLLGSKLVEGESAPSIDIVVTEGALSLDAVLVGPPGLTLRLKNPSGAEVPTDNRAPEEAYFADNASYRLLKVARPTPGTWQLAAGGNGKGGRYAALQSLDLRLEFVDLPEVMEIGKERPIRVRLATPGGKVPPSAFLDRHELALRAAEAPLKCAAALRAAHVGGDASWVKLRRGPTGVYETTRTASARGELCFEARLTPGIEGVLTRAALSPIIRAVPPMRLAAAASSFGSVKQDEQGRAQISFEGSEIGEAISVDLAWDEPLRGVSIHPGEVALASGGARVFELTIAVDRDAKSGPRSIKARAVPTKPKGYEDRAAPVVLSVTIVPLTFWERYGFVIKVGSGILVSLFLALGLIGPARFRKGAVLHYKDGRDADLPREGSYPLAAKAKAGFYRGARLLVGPTGPVLAGGVVELRAASGGAVLARPIGGRKAREVLRDEDGGYGAGLGSGSGSGSTGREVPLKGGVFRLSAGARYEIEGTGLTLWVTLR